MNYQDNATRKTGAISYLLFTSFGMSSNNAVERAKFVNAKPVYFPPMEHKWSNDDYGNAVYKTAVFHDKDGSVGGVPNSYILINDGVNDASQSTKACEIKPTWNAAVCKGDVGRMNVGGGGGAGGGGRGGGGPGGGALPVPAVPAAPRRRRSCRRSWCVPPVPLPRRRWSLAHAWWSRSVASGGACRSAASRSQPQWQGVHRHRGNQRTSRHRDQGDHRKAVRVPHPDGTGCRLVGDLRAAGIHHRSLGYAAGQPGCAAQGQRHLVLQGQGFALGQACLHR